VFQILHPADFTTTPWKNGGGLTHEIARKDGDAGFLWRLSIAEVARDGPFSCFDGYARILTVIDGAGIALHAPDGVLTALPLHPVAFDGATPIEGRLLNGAILDLNLIYDPTRFKGQVERLTPPCHHTHGGDEVIGLLALSAGILVDACPLPSGSFALGEGGEVACEPGAVALRVILRPLL
jgi:environmental stress-induced protein Ves